MRIPLRPSSHTEDPEFVKGWETILTESSLKLIYLSEYEKQTFTKLNLQLEQEIKNVQKFNTHPDFPQMEQTFKKKLEILKSEIKDRKHKKYLRDRADFEQNKVYQWKNKQQSTWNRTYSNRLYTDIPESDCST